MVLIQPTTIVEANPDHSPFLAKTILSASRSHLARGPFDFAMNVATDELLAVLEWMTLSDFVSNCHFSKFVVAEQNGRPVGALAAFESGDPDLLPLGAAFADAYTGMGYDEAELPSVLSRLDATRACLPPAESRTWVVEWVAVEPEFRGRNICRQLLSKALQLGADRSLPLSQISTYLGNEAAIAAYSKMGFRATREYCNPEFASLIGPPGMVAMTRELVPERSMSFAKAALAISGLVLGDACWSCV